jgi:uncharacterized protein YbaR (Trm112 family)
VDPKLLDLLVCPVCKASLLAPSTSPELVCVPCRLAYPLRDGIPVMLVDQARPLEPSELQALTR